MNANTILSRLRRFLLGMSGILFVGSLAELIFIDHTKDPVQWIPFGLCGLGLIAISLAFVRPGRRSLLALRASMVLISLGSLIGIYEHIANNIAFQMEVNPSASFAQLITSGLGGANPLLAPAILAAAAVLALAATYYHPALSAEELEAQTVERKVFISQ